MKLAILGAGRVGTTLGKRLRAAGHTVVYGVRDPSGPPERDAEGTVASVRDAAADADAVLLALPFLAVQDVLAEVGPLGGRPLLDVTNPLAPGLTLRFGHDDSGAEQVQRWAPDARVVKVFNTTGAEVMADPRFGDQRALMLACGDDAEAVALAVGLAQALGFDAHAFGPLKQARLLEPLAVVWISLAMGHGHGRGIALGLLRRD